MKNTMYTQISANTWEEKKGAHAWSNNDRYLFMFSSTTHSIFFSSDCAFFLCGKHSVWFLFCIQFIKSIMHTHEICIYSSHNCDLVTIKLFCCVKCNASAFSHSLIYEARDKHVRTKFKLYCWTYKFTLYCVVIWVLIFIECVTVWQIQYGQNG